MMKPFVRDTAGLTLIEVTISVAILMVVITIAAQGLVTSYAAIDSQELRIEAIQSTRAIMSAVRQKRAELPGNFPEQLNQWVVTQNEASWVDYLPQGDYYQALPGQTILVELKNMAGGEVQAGDNPVQVYVNTTWKDRMGRDMHAQLMTVVTNV